MGACGGSDSGGAASVSGTDAGASGAGAASAMGGTASGSGGSSSSAGGGVTRGGAGGVDAGSADAATSSGGSGGAQGGADSGGGTNSTGAQADAGRDCDASTPDGGSAVDAAGTPSTATGCFPDGTFWPLAGASLATMQDSYSFRTANDLHSGIDLPVSMGTTARSILPGKVVEVRTQTTCSHDQIRVTVSHTGEGCTFFSVYNHLVTSAVVVDDVIAAGDPIGTTGWNCDPAFEHLHFEVRLGCRFSECSVHPLRVLPYAYAPAERPAVSVVSADGDAGSLVVQTVVPRLRPDLIRVRCAIAATAPTSVRFDLEEYQVAFQLGQPLPSVTVEPDPYGLTSPAQTVRYTFSSLDLAGLSGIDCWSEDIQGGSSAHATWP